MRRLPVALLALTCAAVGATTGGAVVASASSAPAASSPAASVAGLAPSRGLQQAELVGRALLPARTFGERVPSGSAVAPTNGVSTPFEAQPVQGVSSVLPQRDGTVLALSDNGYGSKANSADFLLRVQRLRPDARTGQVAVVGGFGLSDPDRRIPFPLTREDRRLTGADFDPESFRRLPDGTFVFGEEFGPFLLRTSATGVVLDAPVPLPGVASPQDPLGRPATLGGSKGFEGLALTVDGRALLALLEGPVAGDEAQDLRLYRFDLASRAYAGEPQRYRLEHPGNAIGEITAVDADRYLVLERDSGQGEAARFKAVFLVDTRDLDRDGRLDKQLLVDLLAVPDPQAIGPDGAFFRMPFTTIESIALLDDETLLVVNDNNFPFSSGRGAGAPEDTEFVAIRLGTPLGADRRALP